MCVCVHVHESSPLFIYLFILFFILRFQYKEQKLKREAAQKVRLFVCGSAALPEPIMRRFYEVCFVVCVCVCVCL